MQQSQCDHGEKSEYYAVLLMRLESFGKVKYAYYFEVLDDADLLRMEMPKPRPVYRGGKMLVNGEEPHDPLRKQWAYIIRAESLGDVWPNCWCGPLVERVLI